MENKTNIELCLDIELGALRDQFYEIKNEYESRLEEFISRNLFDSIDFELEKNRAVEDLIEYFYRLPALDGVEVYQQMINNALSYGIEHLAIQ
ncbi:hypothetical protein G6734_02720 [Polynucleobacter paneuropaeus]|nr:hypothetical protein [Polynucleobacter paneuropaeus]